MHVRSIVACLVLLTGWSALPASAQTREFAVTEGGGSRIRFVSDAPLERMTGTSSAVSGSFRADPSNLARTTGAIEVRIATIRTGIDLRDHHLQTDTWLDAARYPVARFELTGVSGAASITPGREVRVTLRGNFSLHGRTRPVTASARIHWEANPDGTGGNTVRIRARFNVRLTDYGVSIPSIVELKVSNDIVVDVSLIATARP